MRAGPGWSAASSTWVEGYVLALPFSSIRGFGVGGEDSRLDAISTNYIGSVDNQSPLALLYEDINASKGKWLGGAVGRLVSWQEKVPLALKPVTLTAAVFVLVSAMPGTMPGLIYAGF